MKRFRKRLVLTEYLYSLFGQDNFKAFRGELKGLKEGFGTDGHSEFYRHLRLMDLKFSEEKLKKYDLNIKEYQRKLNRGRDHKITLKYFQYLALLFTELYLDMFFNEKEKLLRGFRDLVEEKNERFRELNKEDKQYFRPSRDDLKKIAYWMATGSGKTFIMHANLWQFLRYNEEDIDEIILITPNEGMTKQHLDKMEKSGIDGREFNPNNPTRTGKRTIRVLDIHKLREETGEKTISTDAFEGNNLVFVDEGHKGYTGEEWFKRRKEVVDEGFVFEYSATFGQALNTTRDKQLKEEYSKAIIFDYPFRYFYEDKYGKNYDILNLSEEQMDESHLRFMVANLLSFYEQKSYYKENKNKLLEYNIEEPLWIFIGRTVKATSTVGMQNRTSDVLRIIKFLNRFLTDKREILDIIEGLISGETVLIDEEGRPLFKDRFEYIKNKYDDPEKVYDDILSIIFNTSTSSGVKIVDLKKAEGEIGIKIGDNDYFGIVNIGDPSGFMNKAKKDVPEVKQEEDQFTDPIFRRIDKKLNISILIGAKKFIEGWDSWRVSNMGLMRVGRSEGPQIVQMFGRGIRLLGKNRSLKRSEALEGDHPEYIDILETLNIFGIKADYIEKFEEILRREEIPTGYYEREVDIKIDDNLLEEDLKVPKTPEEFNFTEKKNIELDPNEDFDNKPKIDLYPEVEILSSHESSSRSLDRELRYIDEEIWGLMDWDKIYFDIIDYKESRGFSNLYIPKESLKKVMKNKNYRLYSPKRYLKFSKWSDKDTVERTVKIVLRNYVNKFYHEKRAKWETKYRQYQELDKEDPNISFGKYILKAQEDNKELIEKINKILENKEKLYKENNEDLPVLHFSRHIYQPLFIKSKLKKGEGKILTSPAPSLDSREAEFVSKLKKFTKSSEEVKNKKIFLLRNLSRRGVGFPEAGNFYPDFILWVKEKRKQKVSFIDPHGMKISKGLEDPKVQLNNKIKEIEEDLGDPNIELYSFIISVTNWEEFETVKTKGEYHKNNVFFKEEDYINKLFDRIV